MSLSRYKIIHTVIYPYRPALHPFGYYCTGNFMCYADDNIFILKARRDQNVNCLIYCFLICPSPVQYSLEVQRRKKSVELSLHSSVSQKMFLKFLLAEQQLSYEFCMRNAFQAAAFLYIRPKFTLLQKP